MTQDASFPTPPQPAESAPLPPRKKKFSFPSAFTTLGIILALAALLTWVIPAGTYSKLTFDTDKSVFTVVNPKGESKELPGTQATLDSLGIKAKIDKFKDKSIYKPIAVPGTYEQVKATPQGPLDVLKAPIKGIADSFEIILFVLIIGGAIGVLNSTGTFAAGISALSRATKGREAVLIAVITTLISIGGTTFGMAEETIAFYPILIPVFLYAGFDAMVGIAAIYLGSSIGTTFSTVNPFATVIASNSAGINFLNGMNSRLIGLVLGTLLCIAYIVNYAKKIKADPTKSLVHDQQQEIQARFAGDTDAEAPDFTLQRKFMLLLFAATFAVMVWGVSRGGWWFPEMSTLFLGFALLTGLIGRIPEKTWVDKFIAGAADLVGVALTIGLARGINMIMDGGQISDTILNSLSHVVNGMNGSVFSVVMMGIYTILGFFISSSSGLAVLSMPIMAPLADTVNVPRDVVVSAYQYGQGLMGFITPTGLILVALSMVNVGYDRWLKFVMPLVGMVTVLLVVMLVAQAMFGH